MGRLSISRSIFILLLCLSVGCSNFQRTHNDYDPSPLKMEIGWGAIHCIDFQEVSTLWREVTFEPALVVTCELKSHQCITIRAVNSTHYYTFQGCLPQARVSKVCTEMAYEASKNNGAEYFYCYDVSYDRLNVPANVPLAGRECCCNGDFCNRIENVVTIDTIIPHDQILNPTYRTLHLWYWNTLRVVGICSIIAIVFFWGNIIYIVLKPAETVEDSAWYAAPISRNQINDDDNIEGEDDGEEVVDAVAIDSSTVILPVETAAADIKKAKEVEASKKKKKAKKRASKEETPDPKLAMQTEKTQECSQEDNLPLAKTGDDEADEKKEEKKATKETPEKEKKDDTPLEKEKKTQEPDQKKEEKKEEEKEGPKQFKLCKAKRLANGRVQYVSMFNENSDYSEDDEEDKDKDKEKKK